MISFSLFQNFEKFWKFFTDSKMEVTEGVRGRPCEGGIYLLSNSYTENICIQN